MKSIFFKLSIIVLLLCTSCSSDEKTPNKGLLPDATGGADELLVFMEDHFLNEALVKDIRFEMTDLYKILPQSEVRFSITAVAYSKMNTILKRYRNPIYVITPNDTSPLYQYLYEILNEEDRKLLSSKKEALIFKNNLTASNQNVAIVLAPNKNEILSTLLKYKKELYSFFDQSNLQFFKKLAYIDGVNKSLKNQLMEYHGLEFEVPNGYVLAENEKNYILLRKEDKKSSLFLAFDLIEYNDTLAIQNLGIEKFNEIGKFMDGESENSYVVADTILGFDIEYEKRQGMHIFENGGLWVMENDFVGGGPFVNQYIIDNKRKRVIYLQGMVYGPGEKKKKKYLRQFEAIFNTLKVLN